LKYKEAEINRWIFFSVTLRLRNLARQG